MVALVPLVFTVRLDHLSMGELALRICPPGSLSARLACLSAQSRPPILELKGSVLFTRGLFLAALNSPTWKGALSV